MTDEPEAGEDYLTQDEVKEIILMGREQAGAEAQILTIDLEAQAKEK